jgi:hypothetical protein
MKLEANKYYRCRDGRKAYVAAILPDGLMGNFEAIGVINDHPFSWMIGGEAVDIGMETSKDLISEWTDEPEKKEAKWLYVYRDEIGLMDFSTKEHKKQEIRKGWSFLGRIRLEPME